MNIVFDHFDALAELIDDPYPSETASERARRLVLQATKNADPSAELAEAIDKFEAAFDILLFTVDLNQDELPDGAQYLWNDAAKALARIQLLCKPA